MLKMRTGLTEKKVRSKAILILKKNQMENTYFLRKDETHKVF